MSSFPPLSVTKRSIPTLIPSIVFFISFTSISLLHLLKLVRLKRALYLYLFTFSLLRTCLFAFRIAWSTDTESKIFGIISNVLLSGGFFLAVEALCALLSDWVLMLTGATKISSLPIYEYNSIKSLRFLSPSFSILGAVGEMFAYETSYIRLSSSLRQSSSLGFLCLIIIYIILVTYFALKYGKGAVGKQLKALVLFISAALILIELVYRTFVSFSQEENPIYYYEWVFNVFECIPEIVLLLILGGVILGEWFYCAEDNDELKQLAKLQLKGKSCTNIFNKNNVRREEATKENKLTTNITAGDTNDNNEKTNFDSTNSPV